MRVNNVNWPLLDTSGLNRLNLMMVLREMEIAEGGPPMDEGRGLTVRFHSRTSRELAPGIDGRYFSDVHEAGRARVRFRTWTTDWYVQNIHTRVRGVPLEFAPVELGRVYHKTYASDRAKPVIGALESYPVVVNLARDPARENDDRTEMLSWTEITNADIIFEDTDGTRIAANNVVIGGTPLSGRITINEIEETPSTYRFVINNRVGVPVRIREISLYGIAQQRFDTFETVVENAAAILEYDTRQTLNLHRTYAGATYNGENTGAAATAFMAFILRKYSIPRYTARIGWDAHQVYTGEEPGAGRLGLAGVLLATLVPGDVINMTSRNLQDYMPPGTWFVEGGDVVWDVQTGILSGGFNISQRGRVPTFLSNQRVTATATTSASRVGSAVSLSAGKLYLVAVDCSIPSGSTIDDGEWDEDDWVMQVMDGRNVRRTWLERDIPVGEEGCVSALIRQTVNGSMQINIRQRSRGPAVTVSRIRVWELEDVSGN